MPYFVYVVELDVKNFKPPMKFKRDNPHIWNDSGEKISSGTVKMFYVGQSAHDPKCRFSQHKNCFGDDIPTVAVSDHISAVPEMIQRWVGGQFIVLGTDGYGRSDTREALREFFEIDTNNIVLGALSALEKEEQIPAGSVEKAVNVLGINRERKDKTE